MTLRRAKYHIAALAAIASIRAAFRHKFFPPEAHATAAAMPGPDINFCLINKFHEYFPGILSLLSHIASHAG
jgi:hypothetical protein